jgi:hypothetical protein
MHRETRAWTLRYVDVSVSMDVDVAQLLTSSAAWSLVLLI